MRQLMNPTDFHVLLVLSRGSLYGYAIKQALGEESGGAIDPEEMIGRMHDNLYTRDIPVVVVSTEGSQKRIGRLKKKDYVFGMRLPGGARAWPLDTFRQTPVINDAVGFHQVVVIGNADTRTARAYIRQQDESWQR